MKEKKAKATVLVCDGCGFENEPQRIYCHNCGNKLDRSKLPPPSEKKADNIEDYKKRQSRTIAAANTKRFITSLIKLPIYAAITASLILIFKPPSILPEMPNEDELLDAPMLSLDLQEILDSPETRQVAYSEKQVNGYLARQIHSDKYKESTTTLDATMVGFTPGEVRIIMRLKVFTVPIYVETTRQVGVKEGKVSGNTVGAKFGSLTLPLIVANPLTDGLFSKLWEALKQDARLIGQLRSIAIEEKQVVFTGGG